MDRFYSSSRLQFNQYVCTIEFASRIWMLTELTMAVQIMCSLKRNHLSCWPTSTGEFGGESIHLLTGTESRKSVRNYAHIFRKIEMQFGSKAETTQIKLCEAMGFPTDFSSSPNYFVYSLLLCSSIWRYCPVAISAAHHAGCFYCKKNAITLFAWFWMDETVEQHLKQVKISVNERREIKPFETHINYYYTTKLSHIKHKIAFNIERIGGLCVLLF